MVEVTVKVNGCTAIHVYSINRLELNGDDDECLYDYQVYDVYDTSIKTGSVVHRRKDGLLKLVQAIFNVK